MMKTASLIVTTLLAAMGFSYSADRVALILGNDAYSDVPLTNAVRDARAVKEMLTGKLGFPSSGIVYAEDADRLAMFEKFDEFKRLATEAEIVIVFYAGHGMESLDGKENFLIPVDAPVTRVAQSEAALRSSGVNLMDLTAQLAEATTGAKVILMDCCRERPAGRGVTRAGGGLVTYADAEIPADTLMILAAAPNRVASDGVNHGPFTEALLEVLPGNGNNLMDAFFAVSDRVRLQTENQQVPWLKFDGSGQIFRQQRFLARVEETTTVAALPPAPSEEMETLRKQLAAEKLAREEAEKRSAMTNPPAGIPVTSDPMIRTDPAPTGSFPASAPAPGQSMEGSRAGEVREFGGIEMVWCPPGEFLMGTAMEGLEKLKNIAVLEDEMPQHRVTLTKGFWLAKTETTQAQWANVMKSWSSWATGSDRPSTFQGDDLPVENVSWDDVQGWLSKMNGKHPLPTGWKWVLPTEAQWEYACRAGMQKGVFDEGSEIENEMGWHSDNSGNKTNKVGTKKPNAWGLHDMHGNVGEWCVDGFEDYRAEPATDPKRGAVAIDRVIRSGGYFMSPLGCRAAYRYERKPSSSGDAIGFRPALSSQ